jgi:hypothetical protein
MGVETPRALASFASRCGGNGDFGRHHVGDTAVGRCDERGVPLSVSLDMAGILFPGIFRYSTAAFILGSRSENSHGVMIDIPWSLSGDLAMYLDAPSDGPKLLTRSIQVFNASVKVCPNLENKHAQIQGIYSTFYLLSYSKCKKCQSESRLYGYAAVKRGFRLLLQEILVRKLSEYLVF